MFEVLPNKIERESSKSSANLWPECGNSFELNIFYKMYKSCAGWVDEGYIVIWSAEEIKDYEHIKTECFDKDWNIFGSDGGGTYFGFIRDGGAEIFFFSCDPIDPEGSMQRLGTWSEFIRCVSKSEY